MAIIDPDSVPAFPVYTLHIGEDRETLTLDGAQVPVLDEEDVIEAGKNAIITKLINHNLGVVRARAIDASTGRGWDMIVSATGDFLDLTEQQEAAHAAKERAQRRTKRLMIAGVGTLTVLTLGALGAAIVVANQPTGGVVAYEPEGVGATLPAAPPPQHSTTATWSHPTLAGARVNLISPDRLLTADPEGTVTARNPQTGQPVWRGEKAPENLATIHHSTWAGQKVYVASERNELRLWPVTMPADTHSVSPTTIALEPGQSARTGTHTPYIEMGDWYIRVPDPSGTLHDVMIPPGSTVLDIAADGTITTLSATTIYTLDTTGKIHAQQPFPAPQGTTTFPTHIWTLDDTHLLLAWDHTERVLAVMDSTSGEITLTGKPRTIPSQNETLLVDPEAHTAVLGTVGIRYGNEPALVDLPSVDTTAIHENLIYANTTNGPATVDLETPETEPQVWANYRTEDPAPVLVTHDAVYVVATQLESTTVYRADRQR